VSQNGEPVIRVDHVSRWFGAVVAVSDVTFDIRPGITGLLGPNGAGKTTTLKVLMGLMRATSGQARILGHSVRETAFRRQIGYLPENPYFYDFLTGREILMFYARLSGLEASKRAERVSKLLDWVGLTHAADARLRTYSKGMLQRVGVAQALINDPEVVFFDEPMSGLDPIGRVEIRDLILRLRTDGKTVFMNTHILSDVEMLCDRVAIIVHGRIRYEGVIEKFLSGGERISELVVSGISPDVAVHLEERLGAELRGHGQRVSVRVPDKKLQEAMGLVLRSGAEVVSLTPERASLEEIFMTAGHAADASEPPGSGTQPVTPINVEEAESR